MRLRAVAVVLVAVLAGCNSLGVAGTGSPAASVTPAPVPAGEASVGERLAPGLDADGVTNPLALAAAHVDRLRNRSYTLTYNRTVRTGNGTVRTRQVIAGEVGARADGYRLTVTWNGTAVPDSRTRYRFDGRRVTRERTVDGVTDRRIVMDSRGIGAAPADPVDVLPFDPRFGSRLFTLLSAAGPASVSERPQPGPAPTYRVQTTVLSNLDGQVSDASGLFVVERTGLVRSYRIQYDAVRDGQQVTVVERFQVSNVTTVPNGTVTTRGTDGNE